MKTKVARVLATEEQLLEMGIEEKLTNKIVKVEELTINKWRGIGGNLSKVFSIEYRWTYLITTKLLEFNPQ